MGNITKIVQRVGSLIRVHMKPLTILDVLHIQMNAWHQNANSLWTFGVQKLHHLRVDEIKRCERRIYTVLKRTEMLMPWHITQTDVWTAHLMTEQRQKTRPLLFICLLLGNPSIYTHKHSEKYIAVELRVPIYDFPPNFPHSSAFQPFKYICSPAQAEC